MYKVFFNDSTILIGSEMKKSLNDNTAKIFDFCSNDLVNQMLDEIETDSGYSDFYINCKDCSETWQRFKRSFTEIPAAGGLVLNSEKKLLFIKRFGYWDLPKGKIEKGETANVASVREVEEECGISGLEIIRQLEPTFHIYRSPFLPAKKNLVLKETCWFLMRYSGTQIPIPQLEEDIVDIRWFGLNELDQVLKNTYSSLRDFIEKTLPFI